MTRPRHDARAGRGGPGPRTGIEDDSGQVLLLTIAYAVVALLLVTVVASATAVHLDRKALLATADQAALAGAGALDLDLYYDRTDGASEPGEPTRAGRDGLVETGAPPVLVSDATVVGAVQAHLDARGRAHPPVVLVDAGTPDGATAEVTLRTLSRPPLISWATAPWSDGIVLEATSRARAG